MGVLHAGQLHGIGIGQSTKSANAESVGNPTLGLGGRRSPVDLPIQAAQRPIEGLHVRAGGRRAQLLRQLGFHGREIGGAPGVPHQAERFRERGPCLIQVGHGE